MVIPQKSRNTTFASLQQHRFFDLTLFKMEFLGVSYIFWVTKSPLLHPTHIPQ